MYTSAVKYIGIMLHRLAPPRIGQLFHTGRRRLTNATAQVWRAVDMLAGNEAAQVSQQRDAEAPRAADRVVLSQYERVKRAHAEKLVLMQVGDFYESFCEDAEDVCRILGVSPCRNAVSRGFTMAGFPARSLDAQVARLVRAGRSVVVVAQGDGVDPQLGRGVARSVVCVVTPGTLTDDALLESVNNNHVASVSNGAVCWADVSTGEWYVLRSDNIADVLDAVSPRELLVAKGSDSATLKSASNWAARREIALRLNVEKLDSPLLHGCGKTEAAAASALLKYATEAHLGRVPFASPPVVPDRRMRLDASAMAALDVLVHGATGTRAHSLLSAVDSTRTAGGTRLLARWLSSPLQSVEAILSRQSAIRTLLPLHAAVAKALSDCPDAERAHQRLALGRSASGPRDLATIRNFLAGVHGLRRVLGLSVPSTLMESDALEDKWSASMTDADNMLSSIVKRLHPMEPLYNQLCAALVEDVPARLSDGGLVRSGYSAAVDAARAASCDSDALKDTFAASVMTTHKLSALPRIVERGGYGPVLSVCERDAARLISLPGFERVGSTASAVRVRSRELDVLCDGVESGRIAFMREECRVFDDLAAAVLSNRQALVACAAAVAELDVLVSAAHKVAERGWSIPVVDESMAFEVEDGRHPVVEERLAASGQPFVSNSLNLDRLAIVTGPNMGGKSTFLRQNAAVALLAHVGLPVPASRARMGLISGIFTRIGARDDLSRDASTFLLEVSETARILLSADERALVVVDEVGRGTGPSEGEALAAAVVRHLASDIKCRALFATHFLEVPQRAAQLDGVQNLRTVAEVSADGSLTIHHRVMPGIAAHSHALDVARMAGVPESVLSYAQAGLACLDAV